VMPGGIVRTPSAGPVRPRLLQVQAAGTMSASNWRAGISGPLSFACILEPGEANPPRLQPIPAQDLLPLPSNLICEPYISLLSLTTSPFLVYSLNPAMSLR
jgi:hypothetical protein